MKMRLGKLLAEFEDKLKAMVDNYDRPFTPEAEKAYNEAKQLLEEKKMNLKIEVGKEYPPTSKGYMVFSPQEHNPERIYPTLELATTAAQARASSGPDKIFHVVQIVKTYQAKVSVEEV
jgi:hypothetical protein